MELNAELKWRDPDPTDSVTDINYTDGLFACLQSTLSRFSPRVPWSTHWVLSIFKGTTLLSSSLFLFIFFSLYLSLPLYFSLFIFLSLSFSLYRSPFIFLSLYFSLSISLSIFLSLYLSPPLSFSFSPFSNFIFLSLSHSSLPPINLLLVEKCHEEKWEGSRKRRKVCKTRARTRTFSFSQIQIKFQCHPGSNAHSSSLFQKASLRDFILSLSFW